MGDDIRVYLNEQAVELPAGATVRDALQVALAELLPAADAGLAVISDARGLPVALDLVLETGTILRAARSSRRGTGTDG